LESEVYARHHRELGSKLQGSVSSPSFLDHVLVGNCTG